MYLPSGLQRGCPDETPSPVRGIGSPPLVEIIYRRVSLLSSLRFAVRTAYATHAESGLSSGWLTLRIWKRSSMVIGRGDFCAVSCAKEGSAIVARVRVIAKR